MGLYMQRPGHEDEWFLIATDDEARSVADRALRVLQFMQAMDIRWTGMIFNGGGMKMMLAESFDYIVDTTLPKLQRVEVVQ